MANSPDSPPHALTANAIALRVIRTADGDQAEVILSAGLQWREAPAAVAADVS